MPLNRFKSKTTKEILWIYILKLLKSRDMYAYEFRRELQEKFNFQPALVTSYVVLYKLENGGFVSTKWEQNKKYYTITKEGEKLLMNGLKHLRQLISKLE
jgi:DNA-binding PadR family transcriptional regulator|tara:strand:- start:192 stop:491 length:300 start_codon:yes stop_codon:yes gene_type:complete